MEAPPQRSFCGSAFRLRTSPSSLSSSPFPRLLDRKLHFRSQNRFSVRAAAAAASSGHTVTLLDYGAGNVRSVRNAIRYLGFDIRDVKKPEDIVNADRLVFPGVGAFAAAMEVLNRNGRIFLGENTPTFWSKPSMFAYS